MERLPEIPNYKIIRKIGEGGYGRVYLAKFGGSGLYVALKLIKTENAARERSALEKYLKISGRENMAEILDCGSTGDFLFYSMPLSDPLDAAFPPEDFRWQPKSLQNLIAAKLDGASKPWFSPGEILEIMEGVFDAAISLGESGLLHRDIKPDNILFFKGRAKLSDFGLIQRDARSISNIGTPLYSAPSWYLAKGGNPDAYGIASTLYTLISGNLPDTLGRPAYRFPEKEIAEGDRERWLHWHRCILRCVAENPSERFVTLQAFKDAVFSEDFESSKIYGAAKPESGNSRKIYFALSAALALFLIFAAAKFAPRFWPTFAESAEGYEIPGEIYSKIRAEGFSSGGFFIEDMRTWKEQKKSLLEVCESNYKRAKILSEKSEAMVLEELEKRLEKQRREEPDSVLYSDEVRFKEYKEGEIKMALFNWRLARGGLAGELENLKSLRSDLEGEGAYRKYAAQIYKKYLDSLE